MGKRTPHKFAKQIGTDGRRIAFSDTTEIVARPVPLRYKLRELVSGITPENRHLETNWGPAVGNESW